MTRRDRKDRAREIGAQLKDLCDSNRRSMREVSLAATDNPDVIRLAMRGVMPGGDYLLDILAELKVAPDELATRRDRRHQDANPVVDALVALERRIASEPMPDGTGRPVELAAKAAISLLELSMRNVKGA